MQYSLDFVEIFDTTPATIYCIFHGIIFTQYYYKYSLFLLEHIKWWVVNMKQYSLYTGPKTVETLKPLAWLMSSPAAVCPFNAWAPGVGTGR